MVYYVLVKVTINVPRLTKVIIDVIVRHYRVLESIVTDQSLFFTFKFWFLLCYFLGIKQKLSTVFHFQIDDQMKRHNSTIKLYRIVFVN